MTITLILTIAVLMAGFYMAWNIGANDVANAIGTSVGSGALRLKQALVIAAVLEFAGAYFFGSYVSGTIQKGIVDPDIFKGEPLVYVFGMLAALLSAGIWLQVASYFGWPVSTTHSIVGSVVGFGAIVGGWNAVHWDNVGYIFMSWIFSPLLGGFLSYFIFNLLRNTIFYSSNPIKSAKRLTPILVFSILGLLSTIFLFKKLQSEQFDIEPLTILGLCLLIAMIGALISHLLVRKVPDQQTEMRSSGYNPELVIALRKAKKHLRRVEASCQDDLVNRTTALIQEVDTLSGELCETKNVGKLKSDLTIVENIFSYLQMISACMMAFAHGANDVANAIGPLAAAILVLQTEAIPTDLTIPTWTLVFGGTGIVIGLATWGWRVIDTIGKKITELTPTRGFAAELGAAATIVVASRLGLPISTTHTLVGAVIGVGLARGIEALDLSKTRDIVISWGVTVPAGACITIVIFYMIEAILV